LGTFEFEVRDRRPIFQDHPGPQIGLLRLPLRFALAPLGITCLGMLLCDEMLNIAVSYPNMTRAFAAHYIYESNAWRCPGARRPRGERFPFLSISRSMQAIGCGIVIAKPSGNR
jgi:hypothetical protein